jgi:hypothetical protein
MTSVTKAVAAAPKTTVVYPVRAGMRRDEYDCREFLTSPDQNPHGFL